MMYCAGRSYAMEEYFGSYAHLGRLVCTATGIGNDFCDTFSVHMFAFERGVQVENPRQVRCLFSSLSVRSRRRD